MSEPTEPTVLKSLLSLVLPYPPSINHYYGRQGNRTFLTPKGKAFREAVIAAVKGSGFGEPSDKPLSMSIMYFPPDNRKRDLDNPRKPLQDALMKAGVMLDDSQIYSAREMKSVGKSYQKGGFCYVLMHEITLDSLDFLKDMEMMLLNASAPEETNAQ